MQKYEHKIIDADDLDKPVLSGRTHGNAGWRVVASFDVKTIPGAGLRLILEREVGA